MMELPLPILSVVLSAVACGLIWRRDIGHGLARGLFTGVFALIGLSTLMTGLRFGYGFEALLVVQRLIPLFVGPLIYLGFLCFSGVSMARPLSFHLTLAALAGVLPQIIPGAQGAYDGVILLSYLGYALALILLWRRGVDALPLAPLGLARGLATWMLVAAAMLIVMLVFDTAIALSFALGRPDEAVQLITYGSLVSALSLIATIVFVAHKTPQAVAVPERVPPETSHDRLEHQARALLLDQRLFLDTELTLDRLARRLHVPARTVSEAINQSQSMNVSQYVNGFRLAHAADLLKTTDLPVTQVAEQSGFLSRSNFYREFERVYKKSPSTYRKDTRP